MLREEYKEHELYYDEAEHNFKCDKLGLKAPRISKLRKKIDQLVNIVYKEIPAFIQHGENFTEITVIGLSDEQTEWFVCRHENEHHQEYPASKLLKASEENKQLIGIIQQKWKDRIQLQDEIFSLKTDLIIFDPKDMIQDE